MDRGLRLRATHRRSTRSSHPSRPHTRDERRQLPPQAEPPQTQPTSRPLSHPPPTRLGGERPLPLRSRALSPPKNHPAFISILVPNSSARVVSFHSALDTSSADHRGGYINWWVRAFSWFCALCSGEYRTV